MFGLKKVRKGCLGCVSVAGLAGAVLLLTYLFAPWVFDAAIDWVLYVEPPAVAVSDTGTTEVKAALKQIYTSVEGSGPKNPTVKLSEGAVNGLLGDPSDSSALRAVAVDFGVDSATAYAAIDCAKLSRNPEYADLLADVPSFLRERRVSVEVEFTGLTTVNNRLTFRDVSVSVGRVWVPFSGRWALPLLQRVAEKKLGTRLPEEGLPLPPGSSARMADDLLTVELGKR
ncbi:MAG: hypothetical protein IT175_15770 [Acidobacteria bacterium]|nr:hypothetical protein [Acidobacteriota bacterium]